MNLNYLLVFFLGISAGFVADTDAREAIVGGDQVFSDHRLHQLQYLVSLQINGEHFCGGCIIGEQFILTAAHCVISANNTFITEPIVAVAGTIDLSRTQTPAIHIPIERYYVPDAYTPEQVYSSGDIALLKLRRAVDLSLPQFFRKLLLPLNKSNNFSSEIAIFAGWGSDEVNLTRYEEITRRTQSKLLEASTVVLSNTDIRVQFFGRNYFRIGEKDMAAKLTPRGFGPRGTCNGDGGGPLVHHGVVIGILNKSPIGCSEDKFPSIYTRVSHHLTFIRNAKAGRVLTTMRAYPPHQVDP